MFCDIGKLNGRLKLILDFKELIKDRIVQVLLFVVILNVAILVLLWRLDMFVNGDLYNFGLTFSADWAVDYWYYNGLLWAFQGGSAALAVLSIWPHTLHSKKPSSFSKWVGFLLPTLAIVYQGLCIAFLTSINTIVYGRLYDYGLNPNYNWATTYNPISTTTLALMIVALIALVIPAIRTLNIIKIEIEKED